MEIFIVTVVSLALVIGLAVVLIHARRASTPAEDRQPAARGLLPKSTSAPIVPPAQVVVTSGDQEVMSIMILEDTDPHEASRGAIRLPLQAVSGALKTLVEPLMQVIPSVGTAAIAHSSKLMEVVINGQMLLASDANGLRAIARAGKGFEHARLYEPSNLQNIANATAIWQISSVVVAQKHLADISTTLKRVESKVEGIQSFLEDGRNSVIKSAMAYLEDARLAVESGEFLERTRDKLEHLEIELDKASTSLVNQIQRESKNELERDTLGCELEYSSALAKHKHLSHLAEDLALCNEARLVNWYMCSIYPDNSKMLAPRLDKIKKRFNDTKELKNRLSKSLEEDCALIDSKFTFVNKINERRSEVCLASENGQHTLQESLHRGEEILLKLESVRTDRQATIRLILEAKDGTPSAVYLCNGRR